MGSFIDFLEQGNPDYYLKKLALQQEEDARGRLLSAQRAAPRLLADDTMRSLPVPQYQSVPQFDPNSGAMAPGGPAPGAAPRLGMDDATRARYTTDAMGGPLAQFQQMMAQKTASNAPYSLTPGEVRFQGGKQIASAPFAPKEGFKVGQTREFQRGDQKVTQQWDGTQWADLAQGAAFAPKDPEKPNVQEIFDPESGRPIKVIMNQDGTWKPVGGVSMPAKTFNNDQNKAAGFANTMTEAEANIEKLGGYDPTSWAQAIPGKNNITASPQFQQYKQAALDWTLAVLRQESGANVPDSEAEKYWTNFFPQLGDSQAVIEQKTASRATKMKGVAAASGGAFETMRGKDGPAKVRVWNPKTGKLE